MGKWWMFVVLLLLLQLEPAVARSHNLMKKPTASHKRQHRTGSHKRGRGEEIMTQAHQIYLRRKLEIGQHKTKQTTKLNFARDSKKMQSKVLNFLTTIEKHSPRHQK
jgi:hypothetical protein